MMSVACYTGAGTAVQPHSAVTCNARRSESAGHHFDPTATTSVDGQPVVELVDGDAIECLASRHAARLVTFGTRDFHQILKTKFGLAVP